MNRKIVVNLVRTKYPNLDPSDEILTEFQDQCEEIMYTKIFLTTSTKIEGQAVTFYQSHGQLHIKHFGQI